MSAGGLRWGTEKRLEFIDLRLFWDGVVNRQELAGTFGVSLQQASADFARYLNIAPGNAVYNRAANGYVRSDTFSPRLITPDAARQLAHLRLMAEGIAEQGFSGFGQAPSFDVVPGPARRIDPLVLRSILDAIRKRQEIEITYQAMSRPEPERRWIAPHALAFDGFRWHARARCVRDGAFKDFVLARMSAPGDGSRPSRRWKFGPGLGWPWVTLPGVEVAAARRHWPAVSARPSPRAACSGAAAATRRAAP